MNIHLNIINRVGWSGDRIPVGMRFTAPVQTGPGAHPASCTMGTVSFPGVESGWGVTLSPHPLPVPRSKNRVGLYLCSPLGPSWPVKRVKPTYIIYNLQLTSYVTRSVCSQVL
jgi:hypothetical protein